VNYKRSGLDNTVFICHNGKDRRYVLSSICCSLFFRFKVKQRYVFL